MENTESIPGERKLSHQLQKLFDEMKDDLDLTIDESLAAFNKARRQKEKELKKQLKKK